MIERINLVIEGRLDEQIVLRLLERKRYLQVNTVYGKEGKGRIMARINHYNKAAGSTSSLYWIVLVVLDQDADCAPDYVKKHLPDPSPRMCFRIAVREIESWLLSDRQNIASFLGVPIDSIPLRPEVLADPKQAVINLAKRSSITDIPEDLVPREGSGAKEGKLYTTRMIEFVSNHWNPEIAAKHSDSLNRFIKMLNKISN